MTDNPHDRLEELFDELETITDKALLRKLNKIEEISPSPGFRDLVWAKIERVKQREAFLAGLLPKLSWPAWTFASIGFLGALVWGVRSGKYFEKSNETLTDNYTESVISEFSSPYPALSIENWVVKKIFENQNSLPNEE